MLLAQAEAEEAMHEYTKPFDCRPMDGAFAFNKVLKDVYGMTALGKEIRSFFGNQLPELRTVKVSPTEEVQVPFGLLEFPPLGAQFYLQERADDDYGMAFQVYVMAKKKYEVEIRGLLMLVEAYIREHSHLPEQGSDRCRSDRERHLQGAGVLQPVHRSTAPRWSTPRTCTRRSTDEIWGVVETAELLRENGNDLGNKVLLWGENGTGKTLAAAITAQICLESDWSFIQARWDEDLKHVMRFAELLGTPTVIVIEDMEKLISQQPAEDGPAPGAVRRHADQGP